MRKYFSLLLVAVWCLAIGGAAAQPARPVSLTPHRLARDVYWIEGVGSNSGVIIGDRGVIVFDTKMTPDEGRALLAVIAQLTPKPVTAVILSHSDLDHVGGLPAFPSGIRIIAQQNLVAEMQADRLAGEGTALVRQPTQIVRRGKQTITLEGRRLELFAPGPAHTDSDLFLYLPQEKIVFAGDIFCLDLPYPLIHLKKHGSSAGWIHAAKLATSLDAVHIVPGHGTLQTRQALAARVAQAAATRARVQQLVQEGKSLAQIRAALGEPAPDSPQAPKHLGPSFPTFIEVVYRELSGKAE